ncbi:hypothetical protein [Thermochromatium tepidum]|jgi:hypothetical protein|uniref:Uncharacterized protein n=1 Tax=Thermochromatium tepidum ATCC 43061 TaxID=316276 RepID=A0A6I6EEF4_THETI|nr:hypothetical protein [Thermochromatium tepidum]QGU33656.1 hypothetical protein E6P07_12110 [Thermochromatium tepidum ATCC 43061]
MSNPDRVNSQREHLAYEAARIMIEQGLTDFESARRKAAARIGISDRRQWPSNEALKKAVLVQRRLFMGTEHDEQNRLLKREAMRAMRMLLEFEPRLIGLALHGVTSRQQGVELLLFADRPEDVLFKLADHGIPWREGERTLRYAGGQRVSHPVFAFMAGEIPFALIVLPPQARRQPPLDPITDRPNPGADLADLEQMLNDET